MNYTEEILKIAKFMGLNPIQGFNEQTGNHYYYYNNAEMQDYEALPFYDTWNEIMPVVIKIESLGGDENRFNIFGNCVQLGNRDFVGKTKLEAVTKAIHWWINIEKVKEKVKEVSKIGPIGPCGD
jgi:hypothetical protein